MESTAIQPIFDRDGYIALTVFFTAHKVGDIRREIERVLTTQLNAIPAEHKVLEDPNQPEAVSQIQYLHRYDAYFNALLADQALVRRSSCAGATI